MIIDCHVHTSVTSPGRGVMSPKILHSLPFRFMRWRLGIKGHGQQQDREVESKLLSTINESPLDAACILAFDSVYTNDGHPDPARTHLYVSNDHVIQLCQQNPKLLFSCSVHPHRKDALAELERCIAAGAVSMKWLPIVQGFNPSDPRCFPLYECLAHHRVPLLSHTGGEHTLPRIDDSLADPKLLLPAIPKGVIVIAAHCGTKSSPSEPDYLPQWSRLARDHEHFYGDTAALNLPTRSYAYPTLLSDPLLRSKLLHGSDWPVIPIPPLTQLSSWQEPNWLTRDILIKRRLGLTEDAYWHRVSTLLRLPQ
ncbi:MAG TPA: amidohydrolase family protein [Tepidisphaeraceae bacterium]|jgi:predicted TIM-barrel fold metal-dependent hydrolase|nr:amidohydrolase family protein [Tepidisphaeraceae bacterium]